MLFRNERNQNKKEQLVVITALFYTTWVTSRLYFDYY